MRNLSIEFNFKVEHFKITVRFDGRSGSIIKTNTTDLIPGRSLSYPIHISQSATVMTSVQSVHG